MSGIQQARTELPSSIIGPYLEALFQSYESVPDRKDALDILKRNFRSGQFTDVLKSLAEIDSVHWEICLALRDFAPRPAGFFVTMITVEQLIRALKLYVISWATLLDMLGALVNKLFDLGFTDKDVKFDLILRNKHVQNSKLPAIFKKYSQRLDLQKFKRHRNEIVHRGKIQDKEIEDMHGNRNLLVSRRYSVWKETNISEEEYKKEIAEQNKKLLELAPQKKDVYEAHYRVTLEMVAELLTVLGQKAVELQKTKFV